MKILTGISFMTVTRNEYTLIETDLRYNVIDRKKEGMVNRKMSDNT